MALISDTDYLIHRLRLIYLREVEDPYGPRVISLDAAHTSNPYILASSLADVDRWPELAMPNSPHLSESEEPPQVGGATKLKYTQTIMGGRSGGMGMRTNAKRLSTSKRASALAGTPRQNDLVKNFIGVSAPVSENMLEPEPSASEKPKSLDNDIDVKIQEPTLVEEAPVTKVPQFIPRFKGAEEMERRRMQRMATRRGPGAGPPPQVSFDDSSSEEDLPAAESSDSDFGDADGNDSMDDDDDFDPDFAVTTTRTPGINFDSASDIASDMHSVISLSEAESSPQSRIRSRSRLSPISDKASKMQPKSHSPSQTRETRPRKTSAPPRILQSHPNDIVFSRKPVSPIVPQKASALSAMLKSSGTASNPFGEKYAAISGRGENASADVQVYFPHATEPRGRAMHLNVRKDATVEEVIGFALWTYWEEGWKPRLDEGLSGENDERWETRLSALGWILRITEDDGEVDDDFPPPDRMGKIVKFNADGYAVIEASAAQSKSTTFTSCTDSNHFLVTQNRILEGKIQRRPSRTTKTMAEKSATLPIGPGSGPASAVMNSSLGSLPLSTSLGPLSGHGPQMFLRIRVADAAGAGHVSTTIPVSAGMYMQEALELVCKRRKLDNAKDYALMLADMSIMIPLDRTVASLQGKKELVIIKRTMLGGEVLKATGKTTDPNASIFKRMSDTPAEEKLSSALDFTTTYKKYTIARKMPMLVAKQEKTLAIDGVYLHIMPSTNKGKAAVFDTGKTYSYHIKSIADCQQSTKSSSVFKLVLNRGSATKRYDFEADTPKLASEIVQTVKNMKAAVDRSSTMSKSRRSRQVV